MTLIMETQPKERKITSRTESQMLLIRVILGLSPVHDPVESVRILYEQGREAFDRIRGEPSDDAASWRPTS